MPRSIHTSHRAILGLSLGIYLVLVTATAILPAAGTARAFPAGTGPVNEQVQRGRKIYRTYGCWNCHTQQIRGDERHEAKGRIPVLSVDRRFGLDRPSVPQDYADDDPTFLGTQRTGPDLSTVGSRLPGVEWHYWHLYDPRAVSPDSLMPSMRWLFRTSEAEKGESDVEVPYIESLDILSKRLFATPEAQDLVAYLLSLDRERRR